MRSQLFKIYLYRIHREKDQPPPESPQSKLESTLHRPPREPKAHGTLCETPRSPTPDLSAAPLGARGPLGPPSAARGDRTFLSPVYLSAEVRLASGPQEGHSVLVPRKVSTTGTTCQHTKDPSAPVATVCSVPTEA